MIKTEIVTIGTREFIRTFSDQSMMIERNGVLYEEAIDPVNSGRNYSESSCPISVPAADPERLIPKLLLVP